MAIPTAASLIVDRFSVESLEREFLGTLATLSRPLMRKRTCQVDIADYPGGIVTSFVAQLVAAGYTTSQNANFLTVNW